MKLKRNRMVSWTMVILMMAVIFLFSAKTADASEQMSMGVTQWISKLIGISPAEAGTFGNSLYDMLSDMDHYVRKTAHFLEYDMLSDMDHYEEDSPLFGICTARSACVPGFED